ncbi:hypothetical protein EDD16DRAFT_1629988 [Pisolithus croceorrhizus]|nr:hypothetical protein EDD16DRAFT_1629988 [Pisolithus croceorrhizus]
MAIRQWRGEQVRLEGLQWHFGDKGVKTERGLATFHPHRRYLMVGWISQHAYLEIDNSIVDSVDAIIRTQSCPEVSLLIAERKRRAGIL